MFLGRRASVAGLEMQSNIKIKPDLGGSFRRRMSLASIGSRKYGRALDTYGDGGGDEKAKVIVRHIPIVIEGDESDRKCQIVNNGIVHVPAINSRSMPSFPHAKSTKAWISADDRSSVTSKSSDNSIESSQRKCKVAKVETISEDDKRSKNYNSVENWGEKEWDGRKKMEQNMDMRKPFKDITQNKDLINKNKQTRKTSLPGPQYLIKTETVGVKNCPLHGEGERRGSNLRDNNKKSKDDPGSGSLKAPSLIRQNMRKDVPDKKTSLNQNGRPKHSIILSNESSKVITGKETPGLKTFARGPGQWSFRGTASKKKSDPNYVENKIEEKHKSIPAFQRRWSFRAPNGSSNKTSSDTNISFKAPTISSLSRSLSGPLQLPAYFRKASNDANEEQFPPIKKHSSQVDLTCHKTINPSLTRSSAKMTPSSSTSSIPLKVSKEFEHITTGKPPCIGILKTPGKRKMPSNNRVEFLNNIREREIPGRHA